MESYVVRIYRRNRNSPQNLVGLVELVEVDEEKSFTSFDELRAILDSRQGHAVQDRSKGNSEHEAK